MSELSDTIKGFYSEFILSDLLSFVTPGAIVIGTLAFSLTNVDINTAHGQVYIVNILSHIPIVIWILLFGVFYIVGLGLQILSQEIIYLDFMFPPEDYINKFRDISGSSKKTDCNKTDHPDNNPGKKITFGLDNKSRNAKYYHCMRLPFLSHSSDPEKKTHERFIVLMQASGNCATAFFFSGVILLIIPTRYGQYFVPWKTICFILSVILFFGFIDHRQKLLDWEFEVVNYYR